MSRLILGLLPFLLLSPSQGPVQTVIVQGPSGTAGPSQTSPAAKQATSDAACIRGRVFASDSGRPLGQAQVVARTDGHREARSTTTSVDGTYELTDLPPGQYLLSASRSGYLGLQFGQTAT